MKYIYISSVWSVESESKHANITNIHTSYAYSINSFDFCQCKCCKCIENINKILESIENQLSFVCFSRINKK